MSIRERLQKLDPAEIERRSEAACRLLTETPEYQRAEIVMVYLSMEREATTTQLALRCWSDMKRVLAPRVSWDQRRMLPIEIHSLTSGVMPGFMGVREPVEGMPIPVADIDLVVVPGMAFDAHGTRLGRGRGFYDRFLAHRDFVGTACGLGFEMQFIEERLPRDEADQNVHLLVTDQQVRRFQQ